MLALKAFVAFFLLLFPLSSGGAQIPEQRNLLFHDDLDRESLQRAIQRSLEFVSRLRPDQVVGEKPRKVTAQALKESLLSFMKLLDLWDHPAKLAQAIRSRFEIRPSARDPGEREVLFTGYYQPVLEGSLSETPAYRFPIYRKPDDLVEAGNRQAPYFSRREIDHLERLRGKGYEIAWVKDSAELFFLHIQGSGIIRLEDGRLLHVNYAASNGREYTGIGKLLVESGKIPEKEISLPRIRRYLMEHPDQRDALFARNERYIFFRVVEQGPLGSLEVPLTPGRSLATDPAYFPKGALAFIVSRRPMLDASGNLARWQPFSRFALNQDAGSAIRGPKRADLYFGGGDEAGQAAGFMKSNGQLYFLIPKKAPRD